ncbi:hypothetical protein ACFB49_45600 [Sphingomonas sp. DBB INV C78]|uniref:hypothetical protein n=1 Tax=Sphingomonas sp. DBB INV C78 TaxID=3349434 RepID=UPI0036D275C8
MKKLILGALVLTVGMGVGGGAAYGTSLVLGPKQKAQPPLEFVPTGPVLAPLVFGDGRLASYVSFEVQLEVAGDKREIVEAKLPVLLNAINMRTYRTPMASGPDGLVPSLSAFRKVVLEAAAEAYGKDVVRRAVVTQASPA